MPRNVPAGYERVLLDGIELVARHDVASSLRSALESGTLYEYASRQPEARLLTGRTIAYAAPLPTGPRVVIRHNRHGGMLARYTGDRFLWPTRAPHELRVALRLAQEDVATPEVLGYALYAAGPLVRRSDVVTREIMNAQDLATELGSIGEGPDRSAVFAATIELIRALVRAGAVHHDLNLKNVLITRLTGRRPAALVLDVDRVEFRIPGSADVAAANLRRFLRSARKWERLHQLRFLPGELDRLGSEVLAR